MRSLNLNLYFIVLAKFQQLQSVHLKMQSNTNKEQREVCFRVPINLQTVEETCLKSIESRHLQFTVNMAKWKVLKIQIKQMGFLNLHLSPPLSNIYQALTKKVTKQF